MKVLFLSRWFPWPADNGSKLRVSGLLRALCARHDVTLLSFCNPAEPRTAAPEPGPSAIDVLPFRDYQPHSGRAVAAFLSTTPRFLIDTHSTAMEQAIRAAVARTRFDVVIASQLSMAAYADAFRGVPAIFEEVELGIYRDAATASSAMARARRELTWAKHRRFMARLLERFMLCTVVSDLERQLLRDAVPGFRNVHVVPNAVDAAPADLPSASRPAASLIFTGSLRYAPNRDAMTWFVNDVLPVLRTDVPGVRLTITGDPGSSAAPSAPEVVLAGHVDDVRALVAASAVSIAPIRQGGGTRLKILEAMAVRTPVVATTKAAEGIGASHGEHLLIADTPREYAAAVRSLIADPAAAAAMADRAWTFCRSRYDSSVVLPQFLNLVEHATAA